MTIKGNIDVRRLPSGEFECRYSGNSSIEMVEKMAYVMAKAVASTQDYSEEPIIRFVQTDLTKSFNFTLLQFS